MFVRKRLNQADRVLIAAHVLDHDKPGRVITLAMLSVKCWELWPDLFGLEDFQADHPDPHKVRCVMYASQCLNSRADLIVKAGKNTAWTLTEKGREVSRRLKDNEPIPAPDYPDYL